MSNVIFIAGECVHLPATSKSRVAARGECVAFQRLPTDAYFYADVVIHGAVIGSTYLLFDKDNPSTVLGQGTIDSDPYTLTNVPSYGSPMLMTLRLRKASSPPYYKAYETIVPHKAVGSDFYVAQELDG